MVHEMTVAEALALPVAVDLETAGRAFGIGRTKAHELARRGEFPCEVFIVGRKYRVPRHALLKALGIEPEPVPSTPGRRRPRRIPAATGELA